MQHHVYFWLTEEKKTSDHLAAFEQGLEDLLTIKEISSGIWGKSANTAERPVTDKSFDYAISLEFDTLEAHNNYQDDPGHHRFVEAFKDWWGKVLVMDVD